MKSAISYASMRTAVRIASPLMLVALGGPLLGCGGEDGNSSGTPPGPTPTYETSYYRDIKPIVDQHCASCHTPGNIGVGVFSDYASTAGAAGLIREQVQERIMPPWLASGDCHEYSYDASLSDEQIALIGAWVDEGMPEGDPTDDPQLQPPEIPSLERIDHELSLPAPYSPPSDVADDYRCFILDWPETDVSYVTGFGVRAGNPTTVHHVIAYIAPPDEVDTYTALDDADEGAGYSCYGGPGGAFNNNVSFFGAWAPGVFDTPTPEGTGIRMEPGSKVILQMHYNAVTWDGQPDQTSIVVKVDDSVQKEGQYEFFADPSWVFGGTMDIPAGNPDVEHSTALDPSGFLSGGQPFLIYGGGLHMHTRGTKARLGIERQGSGANECLIDIQRWDFDWQFGYGFAEPVMFQPGDKLTLGCHWDNSPANQPLVGGQPMPPEDLAWGDGTNDEMCLASMYITVE